MLFPHLLTRHVHESLEKVGYANVRPVFVPTLQESHGHFTTNCAFDLARDLATPALKIAQLLCDVIKTHPDVEEASVAPGGFVNLAVKRHVWDATLKNILHLGPLYGSHTFGRGQKINVEYVSANPTGPLHLGHARSAILGDILANIFEKVGYDVTREYYINDAGKQIVSLAHSVYNAYLAVFDRPALFDDGYPGEHIQAIGRLLAEKEGRRYLDQPREVWLSPVSEFAVAHLLMDIQHTLASLGIEHQIFTSEKLLHKLGKVESAVAELTTKNLVYYGTLATPPKGEKGTENWVSEPLLLMRTSHFGDDQDRPLKRAQGEWTYFAGDVAYHLDKFARGFSMMVNLWGADHASHITRMKAAVEALTGHSGNLEVFVCQMVRFFDHGQLMKMSKRAGQFVTIQDVLQLIDQETLRYFMVSKKPETHLDLDLKDMKAQTKDNPVFYVQYAHARCCSVLRSARDMFHHKEEAHPFTPATIDYALLPPETIPLIQVLADWPRQVENSALNREPHLISSYLYKLAQTFHSLWHKGKAQPHLRFLSAEQPDQSMSFVGLIQATASVIKNGLTLLGIKAKEEML